MQEVFVPERLNFLIFFCFLLSILSVYRNPMPTSFHLLGSLDTLLCNMIALTLDLAFSLLMTRALAPLPSSLSDRSYSFLNSQPLFSLVDSYSDYVRVNILLKNFPSPSFLNIHDYPICSFSADNRETSFLFCSSFLHKFLHSGGLQQSSPLLGLKNYYRPSWERSIQFGLFL